MKGDFGEDLGWSENVDSGQISVCRFRVVVRSIRDVAQLGGRRAGIVLTRVQLPERAARHFSH